MFLPSGVEAEKFTKGTIDREGSDDGGSKVVLFCEPDDVPVQLVREGRRDVEAPCPEQVGRHEGKRRGLAISGPTAG